MVTGWEGMHLCSIKYMKFKIQVMWRAFEPRILSRLGKLYRAKTHEQIMALLDNYSLEENEFYFDRDPGSFNCILNYHRTGKLHCIDEVCPLDYTDDLKFWMIDENFLESCCQDKLIARREAILADIAKFNQKEEEEVPDNFGEGFFVPYQQALWDLLQKPQSSLPAKVMSLTSVSVVLVSLCCMCINTFPWMLVLDANNEPVDNPKMAFVEALCISFFTLEFLLAFASSPSKIAFLKGTMNIIDALAIAPYYIDLFFMPPPNFEIPTENPDEAATMSDEEEEENAFGNLGRIMQVFRIARIMRIFKLAKRSVGLQSIAYTVKTSYKDLGLLFSLVFLGALVFGSLEYFLENEEEDTGFYSMIQGLDFKSLFTILVVTHSIAQACGGLCRPSPLSATVTSLWRQSPAS